MFNKYSKQDLELLSKKNIDKDNLKDYPIQYAIGNVNFYGYDLNVDERVLIPRFETEYLVQDSIKLIKEYINNPKIIDIGTGSGCIAISLSKELNLEVDALDVSAGAIELAKENANLNKANINFINEDIYDFKTDKKYNVIISNPPYVPYGSKDVSEEIKYEPQNAIYADNNGLIFYEIILNKSKNLLENKNIICFEIGDKQGEKIKQMALNVYPNANVIVKKDLNNYDRYVYIINN